MKYHNVVREFYNRTFFKAYISVNDLRQQNLHKVFTHPNHSGAFFQDMASEGYLEKIGKIKALHDEARGRPVTCWRWTRLAHARFEGGRR